MTFLVPLSSTIGRRLDGGPGGFLGFGNAIRVPLPTESSMMCCSNIKLVILAIGVEITFAAYFNSSLLMVSGPEARPLRRD